MCEKYGMPTDVSTAVLIDQEGGHQKSASILRMLAFLGFPYAVLGFLALLVPAWIRDYCYGIFAKNRGAIWRTVKQMTGMGDTHLEKYRDRMVGLKEPLDPGWGLKDSK
mmetsp:Transcript_36854/g.54139  ORF Transcript_36854/g.54139 Transcript_36854/m.54139 type:complete len:109 (+) Transcript_36854:306-632(+)